MVVLIGGVCISEVLIYVLHWWGVFVQICAACDTVECYNLRRIMLEKLGSKVMSIEAQK